MRSAEGKLLVGATELTTENSPERGAAQGKSASSAVVPEALPARLFFLVEPGQSSRFTGRMGRQIDVHNGSTADSPERTPPRVGNRGGHYVSGFCTGSRNRRSQPPFLETGNRLHAEATRVGNR